MEINPKLPVTPFYLEHWASILLQTCYLMESQTVVSNQTSLIPDTCSLCFCLSVKLECKCLVMWGTYQWWGHIVFGLDPVRVASFLHSISWRDEWILIRFAHIHHWVGVKTWFYDIDPIFKVTGGQRTLQNAFSALCLLKGWMDFHQTCRDISLGDAKELIIFGWPWSPFQGHMRSKNVENCLVCTLSPEWWMDFNVFR